MDLGDRLPKHGLEVDLGLGLPDPGSAGALTGRGRRPNGGASPNHEEVNKDTVESSRGSLPNAAGVTNYALGRDAASRHSKAFVDQFLNTLSPETMAMLKKCCQEKKK